MINHSLISFSANQIYDLSYNHLQHPCVQILTLVEQNTCWINALVQCLLWFSTKLLLKISNFPYPPVSHHRLRQSVKSKAFYYINISVLQGFLPLRKAIFFTCKNTREHSNKRRLQKYYFVAMFSCLGMDNSIII